MDYKFIDAKHLSEQLDDAQIKMYEKIGEENKGRDVYPAQDDALCILLLMNHIIQNRLDLLDDNEKNSMINESATWIRSVVGYCNLSIDQLSSILVMLLSDLNH